MKKKKLKTYWWKSGTSTAGTVKAKNIKEACIKSFKHQFPAKLCRFDKKQLWFLELQVTEGKLPTSW